jgi:dipeptidyl aminopeptidase/acylaminoacyl peptidase
MKSSIRMTPAILIVLMLSSFDLAAQGTRLFRPDDMFQLRRIGATAWSADGRYATIEFSKPSRWLEGVPSNDISLLDIRTRSLRQLSPRSIAYLGFFNAAWSPDSKRVAFLSVDRNAVMRVWIWTVGTPAPSLLPNVEARAGANDPPFAWIDGDRLAIMTWEPNAERSGSIDTRVLRGRNAATRWKEAFEGKVASVSVLDSVAVPQSDSPCVELLSVDLRTGLRKRLARGRIHTLSVDRDGCCVRFSRQKAGASVASYFELVDRANDVDVGYVAVSSGTERQVLDARTGVEIKNAPAPGRRESQPRPELPPPPRPDARVLSLASARDAVLYTANGPDGSHLWLSGGAGRPFTSSLKIWQANEWIKEIKLGRSESLAYKATDGTPLTAWLLLPPEYVSGTRVPIVTFVYPGLVYSSTVPSRFSAFNSDFEHPQLFAALGYGVLMVSMPEPKNPPDSHSLELLPAGVIPAIDAAIAKGIADPDRIAVIGQSAGGFAVLGLITQTKRFKSAIASAGYSNLNSLYGTLYGQYRHGDAGRPESAQILRMLQFEKGFMGLGSPPWKEPDRYRAQSPIHQAHKVETPLLLIQGELDFIPIQQSEEFFTALFRQDKRVRLLRYAGEGHTISDRANVLHMWKQMESWLAETMKPVSTVTR